uniref:Putative secreted protein n=1 Tax=Anopheles darlingi TaxID=43151 RepID=A0A2M4D3U0_ANODA
MLHRMSQNTDLRLVLIGFAFSSWTTAFAIRRRANSTHASVYCSIARLPFAVRLRTVLPFRAGCMYMRPTSPYGSSSSRRMVTFMCFGTEDM